MKISDLLTQIKQETEYYPNSLILKSSDDNGCVYKYLIKGETFSTRKEIFIELNPEQSGIDLLQKDVISYIEIFPAR